VSAAAEPSDGSVGYTEPETLGLLRRRVRGQSVMEEFLAGQSSVPTRGLLARIFGAHPLYQGSRPWYWGALGERAVGRVLAGLGPAWTVWRRTAPVLHDAADVVGPFEALQRSVEQARRRRIGWLLAAPAAVLASAAGVLPPF